MQNKGWRKGVILGLGLGLLMHSPANAALIVFGDSLSDAGNVAQASRDNPALATDPQSPPYDAQGRMSNGPIWVDYFADRLGMSRPQASLRGGASYAYAGATTGTGQIPRRSVTLPPFTQVQMIDTIGQQIDNYLAAHVSGFAADDLVVLWAGANDLAAATFAGPVNGAALVNNAVTHVQHRLITLEANGATRVVVPNQIDASRAPFFDPAWNPALAALPNPAAAAALLSAFTQSFNLGLHNMLTNLIATPGFDMEIIAVDIATPIGELLTSPGLFGFANVSAPYLYDTTPGKQVSDYVFWDLIHPTTRAHARIAESVYAATVPEPTSLSLLLAGVAAFAFQRHRKQARSLAARDALPG